MNFGKLLGVGASIFGGRGNVSYRENKRVYLPKFNEEKNPFASAPSAEQMPLTAPAPEKSAAPALAPVVPQAAAKTQKIFARSTPSPRPVSWTEKWIPFRAPAPVAPPMVNAVQPELLSLNAVKVLHNDLSDVDVDVVPAKSQTVSAPRLSPARGSLGFMSERELEIA